MGGVPAETAIAAAAGTTIVGAAVTTWQVRPGCFARGGCCCPDNPTTEKGGPAQDAGETRRRLISQPTTLALPLALGLLAAAIIFALYLRKLRNGQKQTQARTTALQSEIEV